MPSSRLDQIQGYEWFNRETGEVDRVALLNIAAGGRAWFDERHRPFASLPVWAEHLPKTLENPRPVDLAALEGSTGRLVTENTCK